ncbi:hypothetical protein Droror1_Dr00019887, partial [Drosera rotundifolia]
EGVPPVPTAEKQATDTYEKAKEPREEEPPVADKETIEIHSDEKDLSTADGQLVRGAAYETLETPATNEVLTPPTELSGDKGEVKTISSSPVKEEMENTVNPTTLEEVADESMDTDEDSGKTVEMEIADE